MAAAFPEITEVISFLPDCVLDAELVVPDRAGRSDFAELQRRSRTQCLQTINDAAARRPAALIVFDVLKAGEVDMRPQSLSQRKAWLDQTLTPRPRLQIIHGVETHGEALFTAIAHQDFEGIVGKKLDAPYKAGRQPTWLKFKNPSYSRNDAQGFG